MPRYQLSPPALVAPIQTCLEHTTAKPTNCPKPRGGMQCTESTHLRLALIRGAVKADCVHVNTGIFMIGHSRALAQDEPL